MLRDIFLGTEYGVLIDIGASKIDVAIISSSARKKSPICLWSDSFPMDLSFRNTPAERVVKVVMTLREVYDVLTSRGLKAFSLHAPGSHIERAVVIYRPPWSRTATRKVHFRSSRPFVVNKVFIEGFFTTLEEKLKEEYREEEIARAFDFEVIEHAVIGTRIDEVLVEKPYGREGKEIEMRHYTGLAPLKISENIQKLHERTFGEDLPLHMHTHLYASYLVLKNTYPELASFCFITVTHEGTECAVVINGVLMYATILNVGGCIFKSQSWRKKNSDTDSHTPEHAHAKYKKELRTMFIDIEKHIRIPRTSMIIVAPEVRDVFVGLCRETLDEVLEESSTIFVPEDIGMDHVEGKKLELPLRIAGNFFHKLAQE